LIDILTDTETLDMTIGSNVKYRYSIYIKHSPSIHSQSLTTVIIWASKISFGLVFFSNLMQWWILYSKIM